MLSKVTIAHALVKVNMMQLENNFLERLLEKHFASNYCYLWASLMAHLVNSPPAMQEMQEMQVGSISRKSPWRRKWQPTPVFLPEKSHGQRSLVGSSPKGHKESNETENTHIALFLAPFIPCEPQGILSSLVPHEW